MDNFELNIKQAIEYWQFDTLVDLSEKYISTTKENININLLLYLVKLDKTNNKHIINNDFINLLNLKQEDVETCNNIIDLVRILNENIDDVELIKIYQKLIKTGNVLVCDFITWKIINFNVVNNNKCFFIHNPNKILSHILSYLCNRSARNNGANFYYNFVLTRIKYILQNKLNLKEKNKIALCFYGCFRGDWFAILEKNLKKIIELYNDIDIFIFTWKHYAQWPGFSSGTKWGDRYENQYIKEKIPHCIEHKEDLSRYFPNVYRKLVPDYLDEICYDKIKTIKNKYLNVKCIEMENQFDFISINNIENGIDFISYCKYKSFEILKEYEVDFNIKYDYVGLYRSDSEIISLPIIDELNNLNDNELYDTINAAGVGLSGGFFGTRNAIEKLSLWRFYQKKIQNSGLVFQYFYHENLLKYYILSGIKPIFSKNNLSRFKNTIALKNIRIPDIINELEIDLLNLRKSHKLNNNQINECELFFKNMIQNIKFISDNVSILNRRNIKSLKVKPFKSVKRDKINDLKIQKGTVKQRIQNHLAYKLGQAMIVNSKSFLGYIRMPFVLSYIKDKHTQEQKAYQEKTKKDPSLKLPPLESYPDYKEAIKEKECLTYKLGEALIKANKTWYKGGYIKLLLEIGKLKKEFKKK